MESQARILAYGSAAALVVAGALCAVLVGGVAGEVLTIVLMAAGFSGAVLLAFLEVGLSEDRERAREARRRERDTERGDSQRGPRTQRRPRRPS